MVASTFQSPTKSGPASSRSILKLRPQTDSKVYLKRHGRYTSQKFADSSFSSPLREKPINVLRPPGSFNKKSKTPNRVVWTRETPMKSCPRNIRRLDSSEKDTLYTDRPDLNPAGSAFNMQAWMDGQDQDEPEYSDSDEEGSEMDEEEYEDTRMGEEDGRGEEEEEEYEEGGQRNVTKSFLSRLQEIASGR